MQLDGVSDGLGKYNRCNFKFWRPNSTSKHPHPIDLSCSSISARCYLYTPAHPGESTISALAAADLLRGGYLRQGNHTSKYVQRQPSSLFSAKHGACLAAYRMYRVRWCPFKCQWCCALSSCVMPASRRLILCNRKGGYESPLSQIVFLFRNKFHLL